MKKEKKNIKNKFDCGEINYSKNFYSIFMKNSYMTPDIFQFFEIKYLLSKKLRGRIKKIEILLIKLQFQLKDWIWYWNYYCGKIFIQICVKLEIVC